MPEMPEVRTVTRDMNLIVKNKILKNVEFLSEKIVKSIAPQTFKEKIIGETIESVGNLGKWILFNLTNEKVILSHLRMTGSYYYFDNKPKENTLHTCVIFEFADGSELHYVDPRRFGTMHFKNRDMLLKEKPLIGLAPEPQDVVIGEFVNSLKKTKRAIKTVILDQKHVLGFGNIYVDETLWAVKVHPETPACDITLNEAKDILRIGAEIMDHSTELGGSSIKTYGSVNGKPGEYQNHLKVFGKAKTPCPRCSEILIKTKVNGRGTTTCPRCQEYKKSLK